MNKLYEPQGIMFHPVFAKKHLHGHLHHKIMQPLQTAVSVLVGMAGDEMEAQELDVSAQGFVL